MRGPADSVGPRSGLLRAKPPARQSFANGEGARIKDASGRYLTHSDGSTGDFWRQRAALVRAKGLVCPGKKKRVPPKGDSRRSITHRESAFYLAVRPRCASPSGFSRRRDRENQREDALFCSASPRDWIGESTTPVLRSGSPRRSEKEKQDIVDKRLSPAQSLHRLAPRNLTPRRQISAVADCG